jgi:hypothetical protein
MLRFELEVKYMRKDYQQLFRLFFMSFVLNCVTTFVCLAEERSESKTVEDIVSADVLRGHELQPVSIMGRPSTTLSYQGFTASTWESVDAKPYSADNLNNYIQTDFGLDTFLSPILTIYKEIINYSQWVAFINISNTYDFNNNVEWKPSASAGYFKHEEMALIPNYDGRIAPKTDNYGSLYDDAISFSLPIAITESLSIIPTLTYAFPFNNDSRNYLRSKGIVSPLDKSNSFVYGGLSVSYSF